MVLSGQFLIDSEASLRPRSRAWKAPEKPRRTKGAARCRSWTPPKGRVELDHEPIPSLQWPSMTMEFMVEDKAQLARLKKGDAVEFELRAKPDADGNYVISRIGAASRDRRA